MFIPADSHRAVSQMDTDGSLEAFQALVGGNIQAVVLNDIAEHCLFFNEEGKLFNLLFNSRATQLFHLGVGMTFDVIVGDAFVAGPVDRDGNDTDVDIAVALMARSL